MARKLHTFEKAEGQYRCFVLNIMVCSNMTRLAQVTRYIVILWPNNQKVYFSEYLLTQEIDIHKRQIVNTIQLSRTHCKR